MLLPLHLNLGTSSGGVTTTTPPSGGKGDNERGRKRVQIPPTGFDFRERKAQEIINAVAARQVVAPELDDFQRQEELLREFEAEGLVLEDRYLRVLASERDRLITQEIASLMRLGQQVEEEMIIILLAASE